MGTSCITGELNCTAASLSQGNLGSSNIFKFFAKCCRPAIPKWATFSALTVIGSGKGQWQAWAGDMYISLLMVFVAGAKIDLMVTYIGLGGCLGKAGKAGINNG